jgi:hypothetical protein
MNRAWKEKSWEEMKELLIRTGSIEITYEDMARVTGDIEGDSLPSHEPDIIDSVQGVCSI